MESCSDALETTKTEHLCAMGTHIGVLPWYMYYTGNSYYPRNGTTWVMLHKGWMLSRGRSPNGNISPRATNPCCTISWVITDFLYFPSGRNVRAFQPFFYRNYCIYPGAKYVAYVISLMLLLQSPWERVLLIQQVYICSCLHVYTQYHAYMHNSAKCIQKSFVIVLFTY